MEPKFWKKKSLNIFNRASEQNSEGGIWYTQGHSSKGLLWELVAPWQSLSCEVEKSWVIYQPTRCPVAMGQQGYTNTSKQPQRLTFLQDMIIFGNAGAVKQSNLFIEVENIKVTTYTENLHKKVSCPRHCLSLPLARLRSPSLATVRRHTSRSRLEKNT